MQLVAVYHWQGGIQPRNDAREFKTTASIQVMTVGKMPDAIKYLPGGAT